MHQSIPRYKRALLVLLAIFLALLFIFPRQSQGLLQQVGGPVAEIVALPIRAIAACSDWIGEVWGGYLALQEVHLENQVLHREIAFLQARNSELREAASSTQRLQALFKFKERVWPDSIATRVIGRDSTNWYRGVLVNKGEQDGIQEDMGVVTPAGLVGRIVKTTAFTSVVLLIPDPNTAVTALLQRTREEGIVTGTPRGLVRMQYIPLLSTIRKGDWVVTSGLTGQYPKGVRIGIVERIEKTEDELFQSAILTPTVDFAELEEVLVVGPSQFGSPHSPTFPLGPPQSPAPTPGP